LLAFISNGASISTVKTVSMHKDGCHYSHENEESNSDGDCAEIVPAVHGKYDVGVYTWYKNNESSLLFLGGWMQLEAVS
jgi:hypothetical protein